MFQKFYPDVYMDSTYEIDFEQLYQDGYRGIIFDIDNTLVTHGAPADTRAIALFAELKRIGFQCCLLSNNKEPRVKMFNDITMRINLRCRIIKKPWSSWELIRTVPYLSEIRFLRISGEQKEPAFVQSWFARSTGKKKYRLC